MPRENWGQSYHNVAALIHRPKHLSKHLSKTRPSYDWSHINFIRRRSTE